MMQIARAIVSVSDKTGIVPFAAALAKRGTVILSTGGTAALLRSEGIPVSEVAEVTGFPEMLGGRVRTLHPRIFGGILGRRAVATDVEEMKRHGIPAIDLVVVNFYPFRETVARPGVTEKDGIESIDIGGPSLLRSAAKSHADVAVLHSPAQYVRFLEKLHSDDGVDPGYRRELAASAFRHVAEYDRAIEEWFHRGEKKTPAQVFRLEGTLNRRLRYGENPHQEAAWYRDNRSTNRFEPLQGKELSYNNLLDGDSALALAAEFDEPVAVIVKHGNPCGVAIADDPAEAFQRALACDPVSAFGGVVALNRPVDRELAVEMKKLFLEVILAPRFEEEALELLSKKKKLRLVRVEATAGREPPPEVRCLTDGFLVMDRNPAGDAGEKWECATRLEPAEEEWRDIRFAWRVVKHIRSNAIVLVRDGRTIGIGAGQMSRVDSTTIAMEKAERAGHPVRGAVLASDGFFPFPDSVEKGCEAGIRVYVQPGGSIRDGEVLAEADRRDAVMILTGIRHFRH